MDAWGVYFIALIPLLVAVALWYKLDMMSWWEAVVMSVLGIITAVIFNLIAVHGMTGDVETWSGQVTEAQFIPRWHEYYEYAVYRTEVYTTTSTDSDGNTHTEVHTRQVFDHWEPTSRWHDDHWRATDTVNGNFAISQERYADICKHFGRVEQRPGDRETSEHNSRMISGDPNDYFAVNVTGYIYPTTSHRSWENRVKAAPSVFSYSQVPPTIQVFEYPRNDDKFVSDRILGPTGIGQREWDQLNAALGPVKKVNLILVNFGPDSGEEMAEYQESKWIGGKKNDLIICCGGGTPAKPTWVKVFGWSERELVKQNIQTIILNNGLMPVILPLIQKEVMMNYEIKDWSKFDYLTVEIPTSAWVWMLIVVLVVTGGWCTYAIMNGFDKDNAERAILGKESLAPADDLYYISDRDRKIREYYRTRTNSRGPR